MTTNSTPTVIQEPVQTEAVEVKPAEVQTDVAQLENLVPAEFDAGETFSGTPTGTVVRGYQNTCAYTPKADPDYIFHATCQDICLWFISKAEPLYMVGPTGSGKTSLVKNVAALLNYPTFEVTGHGRLEFSDLVGQWIVEDGNKMSFNYGPLSLAMKYGGIFLLNEIDITDPATLCGLNSILDGSPLCIPEKGGELIYPHEMFRFVATANTNGGGDETGQYQSAMRQNMAFLDRFWFVHVDYPTPEAEEQLLAQRFPMLPAKLLKGFVKFANEIRSCFKGEHSDLPQLEITCSTRTLIRWADLTMKYQPLARSGVQPIGHALDRALAFRASRETQAVLQEVMQRHVPNSLLEGDDEDYDTHVQKASYLSWGEVHVQLVQLYKDTQGVVDRQSYFRSYTPHVRLRKDSPSGGKFYELTATFEALRLNNGKEGTAGQVREWASSSCRNNNTIHEMLSKLEEKVKSGYEVVRCNLYGK